MEIVPLILILALGVALAIDAPANGRAWGASRLIGAGVAVVALVLIVIDIAS